jgi:hypothetical protein
MNGNLLDDVAIFIKSWKNDLCWLPYCLRSIQVFFPSCQEIHLVLDEECRRDVDRWGLTKETVHYVPNHPNGYLQQQAVKLHAHHYTGQQFILFTDSDCIFTRPVDRESLFSAGKPILLKTRYSSLGDLVPWQRPTECAVGFPVEFEYMRRMPILLDRETLVLAEQRFPNLANQLLEAPSKHVFSEFNFLGAIADQFQKSHYAWADTEQSPEPCAFAKQFWSWGGLATDIRKEIERLLAPSSVEQLRHRNDLGSLLNQHGLTGIGCEIGVAYGGFSETILQQWDGELLFCVDPWRTFSKEEYCDPTGDHNMDRMFVSATKRLSRFQGKACLLRKTSDDASRMFADSSMDFVYVDGNHHQPQIGRDLANWWPKVKPGGIFCGHDFYDLDSADYRCEVKSAVESFASENALKVLVTEADPCDRSWWIHKR